jgi:hypothetical protein
MNVAKKVALLIEATDETLPDLWSRFASKLVDRAPLFDHDNDLLIFSSLEECEAVQSEIEAYVQQSLETIPLFMLPASTDMRKEFTDYGFTSHSDRIYAYANDAYLFTLSSEGSTSQPEQAAEQMEEHLLASFCVNGLSVYMTDSHSDELMQRIARAYRCSIAVFNIPSTTNAKSAGEPAN